MADHSKVFNEIEKKSGIDYPVLVPNTKGLESAVSTKHKLYSPMYIEYALFVDICVFERFICLKSAEFNIFHISVPHRLHHLFDFDI